MKKIHKILDTLSLYVKLDREKTLQEYLGRELTKKEKRHAEEWFQIDDEINKKLGKFFKKEDAPS